MSWESDRARLRLRIQDTCEGIPVWWSRVRFGADYAHVEPKKHVLVGYRNHAAAIEAGVAEPFRDADGEPLEPKPHDFAYTALCGYTFVHRSEGLLEGTLPVVKKTPPVHARCRTCVKELALLKGLGKTIGDYVAGFRREEPPASPVASGPSDG